MDFFFSIVTVSLNNAKGLEETVQSVLRQTYKNYEYIVIDGRSEDDSLKVIKKYKSDIEKWVSEPDRGIYDAMNKGIDFANGNFIIFLNAGDVFYSDIVLYTIYKNISNYDNIYFGTAQYVFKDIKWFVPNNNNVVNKKGFMPSHQSILFPKKFYQHNKYSLNYKIAADREYFLRAKKSFNLEYIDTIFVKFELGGISNRPKSFISSFSHFKEHLKISRRYAEEFGRYRIIISPFLFFAKYIIGLFLSDKFYYKFIRMKNVYFKKIDSF